MGRKCCVTNCTSKYRCGRKDITFHRCPAKAVNQQNKWKSILKRFGYEMKPNDLLCSKHFDTNCFHKSDEKKVLLKKDSIPTIFDFCEQEIDNVGTVETAEEIEDDPLVISAVWSLRDSSEEREPEYTFTDIDSDDSLNEKQPKRRKTFPPRYIADCSKEDFNSPHIAELNWELAIKTITEQRIKIKNLQKARGRQLKKINKLESLLKKLQKPNKNSK